MQDHLGTAGGGDEGAAAEDGSLAELVVARMCHDLANPVGAIGNGVELMRELGGGEGEDLELVASSTARTAALLRLHRLAFGPQAAVSEALAREELAARLKAAFAGERLAFRLEHGDGAPLPGTVARLAALMALAGRALAGRKAEVVLTCAADAALPLTLVVAGADSAWPAELRALVEERRAAATPREVEFALLPAAARAAGATLKVTEAAGRAGLEATAA